MNQSHFSLADKEDELSKIKIDPFKHHRRRYNAKPEMEPHMARWWLIPSWHKGEEKDWKATTFNARIEDAKSKPTFRGVWKYGRYLIRAGGYYDWTGERLMSASTRLLADKGALEAYPQN